MEQPKECKVVFKQIEVEGDMLVATDKDNNIYYKIGYNKDIKGKIYQTDKFLILLKLVTFTLSPAASSSTFVKC